MQIESSVLIIILNYVTYDLTMQLIKQIDDNLQYDNYSIMVVDNCSPNESVQILKKKSQEDKFIFYANKSNSGYAAGNNIGIRYAYEHGYEYTWILNNDVIILSQDVLRHMVDTIMKQKKVAVVGPKIITLGNSVCAPYCRRPTFRSLTYGIVAERNYRKKYNDIPRMVYRVYGCCMLLDTKKMNEAGYMDERTFLYGEEDILAERLLKKGYVAYYDPEVCVKHNESSTMNTIPKIKLNKLNGIRDKSRELYLKEYRGFNDVKIAFINFAAEMIRKLRG
jgi:GT2 family glycosyltransferase